MSDLTGRNEQYDYLRRLGVSELERLLQLAVDPYEDEEDSAYVEALLEVIAEKEKAAGNLPDAKEKWSEFQQYYNTEERQGQFLYYEETNGESLVRKDGQKVRVSNLRRYKRVLLAAAVVALLAAMIPIPAFGHRTVVQQLVACWTKEQFTFRSVDSVARPEIREEFAEVRGTLEKRGIKKMTFPTYIPEELECVDALLYVSTRNGNISFDATYMSEEDYLFFSIYEDIGQGSVVFEKDESEVETFVTGGEEHYIMSNNGSVVAVWYVDDIEQFKCLIDSSVSVEEIKRIIDSMYRSDGYEEN